MNLTLRDVDYFLAVARTGRLAQAAEACNVTQPALTKAIQRLESEIGLVLFERDARGTRLTAEGLRFVDVAQGLSASYADATRVATEVRAQQTGLLRIGVTDITRNSLAPRALAQLLQRRPGLRAVFRIGQSDQLARALRDGSLDMALVPTYGNVPNGCEGITVANDPHLPVVRAGHPLARRLVIELADLQPFSWILAGPHSNSYRTVAAILARHDLPPPQVMVETEYASEAVLALVQSTDLLALMPRSLLQATDQNGLHLLPLLELRIERAVVLAWREGATWSPLMEAFKETLETQIAQRSSRVSAAT